MFKIVILFVFILIYSNCRKLILCPDVGVSGYIIFNEKNIIINPDRSLKKGEWVSIKTDGDLIKESIKEASMEMSVFYADDIYHPVHMENFDMSNVKLEYPPTPLSTPLPQSNPTPATVATLTVIDQSPQSRDMNFTQFSDTAEAIFSTKMINLIESKRNNLKLNKDDIKTGHFSFTFKQFVYTWLHSGDYMIRTKLILDKQVSACTDYFVTILKEKIKP
jgi:hypothetical protein